MGDSDFKIDLGQAFPHLNKAPILEAVIEIRTRAEAPWEEASITQSLKSQLPDYPGLLSLNQMRQQFTFGAELTPQASTHDLGWSGLRLQSADKLHVAQLKRDGFSFSRLAPYETWEQLEGEANRLWLIYVQLAKPLEVHRLGVRFINKIPMSLNSTKLEDYIQPHPETPNGLDLPFSNFLHRETLIVPGYDYGINLTRTLQRTEEGAGIILDIDVFTTQPSQLDEAERERRLTEMRWLKNKCFFGTITKGALENLQ